MIDSGVIWIVALSLGLLESVYGTIAGFPTLSTEPTGVVVASAAADVLAVSTRPPVAAAASARLEAIRRRRMAAVPSPWVLKPVRQL